LFLLFDIEILLIFPYAVSSYNNSYYGLVFAILFLLILSAGFVFEIGRGALQINSRQTGYLESSNFSDPYTFVNSSTKRLNGRSKPNNLYHSPLQRRSYSTACKPKGSFPFPVYTNAEADKSLILAENKGKVGVYCWTNLSSGKRYVGSSASLARRLWEYYSVPKLVKFAEIGNSIICRALLKHGHKNFKLEILCYCEPKNVLLLEQYYINSLNPEYNILQVAGSPLGHKHTEETLAKMRAPKSPEHLAKLRENIAKINIDRVFSEELRLKISKGNGHRVAVTDTVTGETKEYHSISVAAQELGSTQPTVSSYMKTGKLFRDTYKIVLKEPGSQLGKTHYKKSRILISRAKRGIKLSEATKLAISLSQPNAQIIEVTDLMTEEKLFSYVDELRILRKKNN